MALDRIDLRILAALQRNGRISKVELANLVNLSASACLERMSRLEKRKLILSYHANVGGGIDYILKVVASDVPAYQSLIDDLLGQDIGIERYFTYVVTKVVKSMPQFPLEP